MIFVVVVGRNNETGLLQIAKLTEKGKKLYNQFDFHSSDQEMWLDWEECESFETLTEAVWDALELEAKAKE